MRDCAFQVTGLQQGEAEIILRVRVTGADAQRFFGMRNRFAYAATPHQKIGQAGVRKIIVLRHRDRMCPERFAVAPVRGLHARGECKRENDNNRRRARNLSSITPTRQ